MAYTPTSWTTGDTITATKLNKLENGVANAGSSYDIVMVYDTTATPATCVVAEGDILDCEDKVDRGELVNGVCIVKAAWSWLPSGKNTEKEGMYLPLSFWTGPYSFIGFGSIMYNGNRVTWYGVKVDYNPSTGAINNFAFSSGDL